MKKFLLILIVFILFILFLPVKNIYAQGVGVHHYNLGDIEQIKAEMAAGMPATFWATPGDGNLINELNEYNKSLAKPVQLTIEDPDGGYLNTVEERIERGKAWVATLGGISESPVPLALMTSNEDETWRCNPGDQACFNDVAHLLADSNISLYNTAIEAGAAGKFVFASPMINITHADYFTVVALINQAYAESSQKIPGITPEKFPDLFGVWLLNEYVTIKPDGSYYLPEWQSAWGYDKWDTMPLFAKEFGVRTDAAGVTYDRGLIEKAIIEFFLPRWLENPNHLGGTILNLEGLVTPEFIDFLKNIQAGLQNRTGLLSGQPLSPEDYEKYKKYLEEALKNGLLVKCPNGGYARKLEDCKPKEKPKHVCSTTASAQKPTTFRPAPCQSCSDPYPPTVESCATPFKAYTVGRWCLDDITSCNGDFTKTFDWGGDIKIDFTQTKVPFAGYGKADEIDTQNSPATTKYLADYFDGTLLYSEKVPFTNEEQFIKDVFLKGGVFRKLAPQEIQDEYKLAMIGRAHRSQQFPEGEKYPIRDYLVKNPDPIGHPHCQDKNLIQFITQLGKKPMRRSYNSDLEYQNALKKWQEKDGGCWPVLWSAVPMFTREDGLGQIYVQAQSPGSVKNNPFRATFPHLPRLYEVTQALQKMLFPQWPPHSIQLSSEENNDNTLLASAESLSPTAADDSSSNCLAEQTTLLAQGEEAKQVTTEPYIYLNEAGQLEYGVIIRSNGNTNGHVITELQIDGDKAAATMNFLPTNGVLHYGTPGSQAPGDVRFFPQLDVGHTIKFMVKCDDCGVTDASGNVINDFSQECQTSTSATGALVTNCQAAPPVSQPPPASKACQSPDSYKACFDPNALTDDNPNDPICVALSKNGVLNTSLDVKGYKAKIPGSVVRKMLACFKNCKTDEECAKCDYCDSVELSRMISVKTQIPWLSEIWKQTTAFNEKEEGKKDSIYNTGLFHIFTPAVMQNWQPKQAKTPIAEYSFAVSYGGNGGGASPDEGELYYPKLGGVEEAKECLTQYMLLPDELSKQRREQNPQEFYEICPPFRKGIYDCCDFPDYQQGLKVSPDCCRAIRETCPECYEGPKEVKDDPKYCDQAKIDQKNWEEYLGGKEPSAVCK